MVIKLKKIIFSLTVIFALAISRIFYLSVLKNNYYKELLDIKTNIKVEGLDAPRGRILDVNNKVLVDNVGINCIIYNKSNINVKDEIKLAYKLASNITDIQEANIYELKKFYLVLNNDGNDLIKKKEYQLYNERKLDSYDLNKLK